MCGICEEKDALGQTHVFNCSFTQSLEEPSGRSQVPRGHSGNMRGKRKGNLEPTPSRQPESTCLAPPILQCFCMVAISHPSSFCWRSPLMAWTF